MSAFIFALTLRQIAGRKSIFLLIFLNALPVLIATVFRLSDPEVDPERWAARVLYLGLLITTILPLTTLLLSTSVIGDEIEDGTAVYLLTKPLQRWQIFAPKLLAAWLVAALLLAVSALTAGSIALSGRGDSAIIAGFTVAAVSGALAYSTVFVYLSVATSRALITGLIYVFVWEGAITTIFAGTRYLSIRHFALGIAESIANTPPRVFDAYVGGATALILLAIATVTAGYMANRRLARVEIREPS